VRVFNAIFSKPAKLITRANSLDCVMGIARERNGPAIGRAAADSTFFPGAQGLEVVGLASRDAQRHDTRALPERCKVVAVVSVTVIVLVAVLFLQALDARGLPVPILVIVKGHQSPASSFTLTAIVFTILGRISESF
jgi:hypothetical protein